MDPIGIRKIKNIQSRLSPYQINRFREELLSAIDICKQDETDDLVISCIYKWEKIANIDEIERFLKTKVTSGGNYAP